MLRISSVSLLSIPSSFKAYYECKPPLLLVSRIFASTANWLSLIKNCVFSASEFSKVLLDAALKLVGLAGKELVY